MDLDARLVVVGALDQVGQRVEAGGKRRVFDAGLQGARVEGVAATAHLDDQGVDVGAAGVGEEAVDLLLRS